jgi:glycine betaine/choline ABC-type transport system substrate-binding protein
MTMKRISVALFVGVLCLLTLPKTLHTCVGRLLVVAVSGSADQVIMGNMLSVLINERTGTTVDVIQPGGLDKCHEAVLKGKANIYLNYIAAGHAATGGSGKVEDAQKVYTLVSAGYLEKFGMVWLKPFGFEGPLNPKQGAGVEVASLAVPVTTKDVLRKFPVLDRVINKLGGQIDNPAIDELAKKSNGGDVKLVVKEFLKAQKLI